MKNDVEVLLRNLQEREKELNCLYNIEEILNRKSELEEAFKTIIKIIPSGWQFSDACHASIVYQEQEYSSPGFHPTQWQQTADIEIEGNVEGRISVFYTEEMPHEYEGPFLEEERKLLDNIVDRIGKHIFHIRSKHFLSEWEAAKAEIETKGQRQWQVIVDLLRRTDHELFFYIARKMTYFLCWNGINEAQELLRKFDINRKAVLDENLDGENKPSPKISLDMLNLASKTFDIAPKYFTDADILDNLQLWIQENKTNFLVQTLEAQYTSMSEIVDAIRRFHHLMPDASSLPDATQKAINSALVRRFFTGQPQFVRLAREYTAIGDMYELIKRIIHPLRSRGRLGGKSAGLFLAAQIIKKLHKQYPVLEQVKTPKTWYITSDEMLYFMYSNNLFSDVSMSRLLQIRIVDCRKNSF